MIMRKTRGQLYSNIQSLSIWTGISINFIVYTLQELSKKLVKLNLWLTAPKGATPVNYTSATDWQMAVRRDNVISTLRQI